MLGERPFPKQGVQRGAQGGLPEPSPTSPGCPATARTTRRALSFLSPTVCICGISMPAFLTDLGQVGLKVSSASPHSSLCFLVPAISCTGQGAAGQAKQAGKGAAGTSPNLTRRTSCAGASSAAPISRRKPLCSVPLLTTDFQSWDNCTKRHSSSILQAAAAPRSFSPKPALP